MDPQACMDRIIQATQDRDREAAREALQELWNWLAKGGLDNVRVLDPHKERK